MNPKVYEALRRRGYSKERAARISNAKRKKDAGVVSLAIPPTGPNALFNQPGISRRQKRLRSRALCDDCRLKEAGVTRIRGNLCNVHGRYGRCPGAPVATAKPAKGGKPAKPKKTPEQRQTERAAARAKNTAETLAKLNIAPDGQEALAALARGEQPDPAALARGGFEDAGLVEKAEDGSYRMTPAGHALLSAAGHGDLGRAGEAISRARDRMAKKKPKEPKAGGGGGGKGKPDKAQTARDTATKVGLKPEDVDALRQAAEQGGATSEALQRLGLVDDQGVATSAGRQALRALERGDLNGYQGAVQIAQQRMAREATRRQRAIERTQRRRTQRRRTGRKEMQTVKAVLSGASKNDLPDSAFLYIESGGKKDADGKTVPRSKRHFPYKTASGGIDLPHLRNALARIPQSTAPGLNKAAVTKRAQALLAKANKAQGKGEKSFTVFKQSNGSYRWVALSSNAYRDRDNEIVSTKALADDCQRADQDKDYGPLRWWHQPSIDIGQCDFNAMHDRMLVESGTFKDAAIGQRVAENADNLQMSIGFTHAADEPDRSGVFHHIRRFERSLVPIGRAANPFTQIAVKEIPDMASLKEAWGSFVALFDGDEVQAKAYATAAEQTQKALDDRKAAYKDAPEWAQALITRIEELETTVKAGPMMEEGSPEEEAAEPEEEAMAEGDTGDDGSGDNMLTQAEIDAIAQAVVQAISPLLDLEKKMAGHMADLKQTFAGYSATKDDRLSKLETQVKELYGDLPSSVMAHAANVYRQSQATNTLIPETQAAKVKEALNGIPAGLTSEEAGAYRLIFGE